MAISVTFIDTSVLCNVLEVPGFCQDSKRIKSEMRERMTAGEKFILPMTAVIETGNHIAHIPNGDSRRKAAVKFSELIELVITQRAPWTLNHFEWGEDFLFTLKSGCNTGISLVDHATAEFGTGDLCILAEREIYKERATLHSVDVWTLDGVLAAYN